FSIMTISKVYETKVGQPTVVTRLNLVNGSVRAGVERGRTQSDFQVKTPVATLSVRGTRPVRLFFNAGTGQLWFYLGREGWIRGTLAGGGRHQDVRPGEGTDQSLTLPILMAIFDQHVQLGDPFGGTLREFIVEVTQPNAIGNFGGGNPQTIIQQILAADRAGQPSIPRDDSFYPDDDDSTITSPMLRGKHKGK
ncbi:MAG: FecR domain-containing protein, partial [Phycisphaerae bacterium]|nr:FecR domain-containing protein [Phycisphaerae bacterium]